MLTRTQKNAAGGTLNIVQTGTKRVLGGNTFVIATGKAIDKTFWLRLAEDWLKLAQEADKPSKRR